MRRLALTLALACIAAVPADRGMAQLFVYTTSECFAFWKLKEKLDRDGVGAIVVAGPKGPGGGLPEAQMERVTLYLDLEEKLRFRCPDFAPPPDRAPGKRQPDAPPVVTANPGDAVPAGGAQPQPQGGTPAPARRPPQR